MWDRNTCLYAIVGVWAAIVGLVAAYALLHYIDKQLGATSGLPGSPPPTRRELLAWMAVCLVVELVLIGNMIMHALYCRQRGRCPHCGKRLSLSSRRCSWCGTANPVHPRVRGFEIIQLKSRR